MKLRFRFVQLIFQAIETIQEERSLKLKFCPDFMLVEMSTLVPTVNKLPSIRQQVYSSLDIETSVPEK